MFLKTLSIYLESVFPSIIRGQLREINMLMKTSILISMVDLRCFWLVGGQNIFSIRLRSESMPWGRALARSGDPPEKQSRLVLASKLEQPI